MKMFKILALFLVCFAATAANARLLWDANVRDVESFGVPVILNQYLFQVATYDKGDRHIVFAMNRFNGDWLWSRNASGPGMYADAGAGMVFYASNETLFARHAHDGKLAWQFDSKKLATTNASTRWPGKVTFTRHGNRTFVHASWINTPMVTLDAASGEKLHVTDYFVAGRMWPAGEGDLIFVTVDAAQIYTVNRARTRDGKILWSRALPLPGYSTVAANQYIAGSKTNRDASGKKELLLTNVTDGSAVGTGFDASATFDYNLALDTIFQGTINKNGTANVVTAIRPDGTVKWRNEAVPSTYDGFNVMAGDELVVLQGDKSLIVLDAVDGHYIETTKVDTPYFGAIMGRHVYVGHGKNKISGFAF